ncbi:hypothetical protein GAO09_25465 [Rhizobiales bacterium RZME27]|uniref:Uncharacterized protein n=1 Tax=Endobacterium cereale TaxID=2663029 RepID=A0A6A8AI60_9HYPH|nr:hypothetical protein [Endobacterium cereale]MEB2843738.1 hypothetical protein [Endobacterium cereale]MQY49390.1 hypothetical protein [Endobacterium cereale]
MPQDLVVRGSRGLHALLALLAVILLVVLLPFIFQKLAKGGWVGIDMLLVGLAALCIVGLPLFLKAAWKRKVELVAFHKGLFWPALRPDVIPWNCVESVCLSHSGKTTIVQIVLSAEIEAEMQMKWLARFVVGTGALMGSRGRHFGGLCNHSKKEIVHVIDDWIRYETRQAPKRRYRPGAFDAVLRFLR